MKTVKRFHPLFLCVFDKIVNFLVMFIFKKYPF